MPVSKESLNHGKRLDYKTLWEELPPRKIQSGDVLIKHVWSKEAGANRDRSGIENMIRFGGMLSVFDKKGSQSAEHVALVGEVNGKVRIFEAESEGIRTKTGEPLVQLTRNTAYSVFRCDDGSNQARGLALLFDAMATRLAQIEGANPCPIHMPRYETVPQDNVIRKAAKWAHVAYSDINKLNKGNVQSAKYNFVKIASPISPNIIPDILGKHHEKMIEFIAGQRRDIWYLCSGFAASMLHAWHINYFGKRVFIDPSLAHPTNVEHHLMKGHLNGFRRIGRYGGGVGGAH